RFGVEDVRPGAGSQRGLERGVERGFFVPRGLDLDVRVRRLEALDRIFHEIALDLLRSPMAPHRELDLLRQHARRTDECQCCNYDSQHAHASSLVVAAPPYCRECPAIWLGYRFMA